MAYIPLPNQAKVNCAPNQLVRTGPTVSAMPYTLRAGAANSDAYYHTISAFADDWLLHAQDVAGDLVDDFQVFWQATGGSVRSFAERAFELLALGVLLREHGTEAASLPKWLAWTLNGLIEFQSRVVWAERAIKPVRGFLIGIEKLVRRPQTAGDGIVQLVIWLRAHGERAQADRLSEWQSYFDELGPQRAQEIISRCLILADDFARESASRLGTYTEGVERFVLDASAKCRWRYDGALVSSSRLEYHLAMLGTEILSRAYREQFLACERRVVVLPDCMRRQQNGRCKAVRTALGGACRYCTPDCRVHQVTRMGQKCGFEVYILPDELRDLGVQACSAAGKMGVVGVSCALTNWHGGWQLEAAGVPAQGVLLDYAGCKRHWDEHGLPTDVNLNKLREVVGRASDVAGQ